jgi:hypothetical protein
VFAVVRESGVFETCVSTADLDIVDRKLRMFQQYAQACGNYVEVKICPITG